MTAADLVRTVRISDVYGDLTGVAPRRAGRDAWRGPATWRGGDGSNVSLDDSRGLWHDFVTGDGGGVLDLVQRVRGGNRAEALRWLADLAGLALDDLPASREERRAFGERQQAANVAADRIASWRDALIPELNADKVAAVHAGSDEALARAASLCNVLENGSPADVIREFIRHRTSYPADVARLIATGRERDLEAQRRTAEAVFLIARTAAGDSRDAA